MSYNFKTILETDDYMIVKKPAWKWMTAW